MKVTFLKHLRAGFSLIEVNMAIFVLAGGALALLGLFPLGLRESLAARHEMRVAAFSERVINAARVAALDTELKDIDDFRDALEDVLEGEVEVMDDAGDSDDDNAKEDKTGVYYRVWVVEDPKWPSGDGGGQSGGVKLGNKRVGQVGVQATAENAKQNKKALRTAPLYVVRVVFDVQAQN